MKCLVTGATGFVGLNLVRELLAAGHRVTATGAPGDTTRWLDGLDVEVRLADLTVPGVAHELVAGHEWVAHVAGDTSTWSGLSARRRRVNVLGPELLGAAALRAGVQAFLHTSTIDVLGYHSDGSPVDESGGRLSMLGRGYDYADTKAAGDRAIWALAARGLPVRVVHPGFMIGPYDHTLQFGRVVRAFREGRRYVSPPGTSSWCDVRAVARGMVAALEHGSTGDRFILAGDNRGYQDVFGRAAELLEAPGGPITVPRGVLRSLGRGADLVSGLTRRPLGLDSGLAWYLSLPQAASSARAAHHLGYHHGEIDTAILDAVEWYDSNGS